MGLTFDDDGNEDDAWSMKPSTPRPDPPYPLATYLLDTSCLVKYLVDERDPASGRVRLFLKRPGPGVRVAILSACFYEALGVLKAKHYDRKRVDRISVTEYRHAALELISAIKKGAPFVLVGNNPILELYDLLVLIGRPEDDNVDMIDGLLLHEAGRSLRPGFQNILVTADWRLAKAARGDRIWTWHVTREARPAPAPATPASP